VSSKRLPGRLAGLALCLLVAGCAKQESLYQRIAVLPFENLAAEAGLEWMSRGLAEVLVLEVAGSARAHAFTLGSLREVPGTRASHVLHGYFARAGAGLRLEAVLEDGSRGRVVTRVSARAPAGGGVLALAHAAARELKWQTRALGVSNEAALRGYVEGLAASDAGAAGEAFQRAVAAEADFGAAYLAWAERLAVAGDASGARRVAAQAARLGERVAPIERARLAVLEAALAGDRAGQQRALLALAQVAPAESEALVRLGSLEVALGRYTGAVRAYQQAAARDPDNALVLNQLGYAQSYTRDLEGAAQSLRRYAALRPEDANPLDSLGDVHYYLGRFAEAERHYLEAWRKDPSFLGGGEPYKVAWARLMPGKRAAADELFAKYIEVRKASGDPLVELRRAEWEYLTGRRKEAATRLEGLTKGAPSARAWAQMAVWSLDAGDRVRAREYAARAAAAARDPAAGLMARVCQYLAGPEAGAPEWAVRAERTFPEPALGSVKRSALAYALLWAGQFGAALPALKELYAQTPASSAEPVNVLLAWALVETGRASEVGDLLDTYPAPQPGVELPFQCLSFPRVFRLRGAVLEKQGRRAEAQGAYRLFEALSGAARS